MVHERKNSTLSLLAGSANFTQRLNSYESVFPRLGGYGGAATFERYQTMLNAILFVILGMVVFWLLAAIFEAMGFTKHRYVARGFAALLTIAGAFIGTGYRHWLQVLIGIGAAFVYLQTLRKSADKSAQESR
jgi:hypothetical protein